MTSTETTGLGFSPDAKYMFLLAESDDVDALEIDDTGANQGGGDFFLVDIVGSSAEGSGADPVGDTLVFIDEPDAPSGGTVYPEVDIHFTSTVGNSETGEREIFLTYQLEPIHDEPLPPEDPLTILEIEWM